MLKIIQNPNKEIYNDVTQAVINNDNYCPCEIIKSPDTKCPCKLFREQQIEGECHCGRFIKIQERENI